MSLTWRDALLRLHVHGWNADDIDEACEALYEACSEGMYEGGLVDDLTPDQARSVLNTNIRTSLLMDLQQIAALRSQQTPDAERLRRALYDLDAFAYEFGDDTSSGS